MPCMWAVGVLDGEDVMEHGHTGALAVLCGGACCGGHVWHKAYVMLKREHMLCYVFLCVLLECGDGGLAWPELQYEHWGYRANEKHFKTCALLQLILCAHTL